MTLLFAPVRRFWSRLIGAPCDSPYTRTHPDALYCRYDGQTDLLFARFGDPEDADTVVLEPDLSIRISRRTHQPVAIEVVDCAAKFHKQPSAITPAFARELLARYGIEALRHLKVAEHEHEPRRLSMA